MQTFFIALADRTRRRVLNLMREHEISAGYFTDVLDVSQPKISRHLAYLRNAGIVSARREGKWIYYRIVEPVDLHAAQVLRDTLDWLESQETMQKDYEKLNMIYASDTSIPETKFVAPEQDILPEAHVSYEREELEIYLL
jgi:ArsR family transcriptional regulator